MAKPPPTKFGSLPSTTGGTRSHPGVGIQPKMAHPSLGAGSRPPVAPPPVTWPGKTASSAPLQLKAEPCGPKCRHAPPPIAPTRWGGTTPVAQAMFSGTTSGQLNNNQINSGFGTFAQVNFTPTQSVITQSYKPSATYEDLVGEDLVDDEHNHAEDYVTSLVPQRWIELGCPQSRVRFDLYITSSPCSSDQGTSGKDEGCAEKLARLYESGIGVKDMSGMTHTVYFQIGTLRVKKLYRPKVTGAAEKSFQALFMLKHMGVCERVVIEKIGKRTNVTL